MYCLSLSPSLQKITYDEFLPALLGHKLDSYPGYDDSVDARVTTEFATAGFLLEHTMVTPSIAFLDNNANELSSVGTYCGLFCVHAA